MRSRAKRAKGTGARINGDVVQRVPCTGTGPLSTNKHHGTGGWHEVRLIDAVTLFFFHNHRLDIGDEILIRRAFPEQRAQIVVVFAEDASTQLAVGGQAAPRTLPPPQPPPPPPPPAPPPP